MSYCIFFFLNKSKSHCNDWELHLILLKQCQALYITSMQNMSNKIYLYNHVYHSDAFTSTRWVSHLSLRISCSSLTPLPLSFLFIALQSMPSHSVTQPAETGRYTTPPPGENMLLSTLKPTGEHFISTSSPHLAFISSI